MFGAEYLKTVRDRLSYKGPPIGNGYGESNSHVTDVITWPWKVIIWTSVGYTDSFTMKLVRSNMGIELSIRAIRGYNGHRNRIKTFKTETKDNESWTHGVAYLGHDHLPVY